MGQKNFGPENKDHHPEHIFINRNTKTNEYFEARIVMEKRMYFQPDPSK